MNWYPSARCSVYQARILRNLQTEGPLLLYGQVRGCADSEDRLVDFRAYFDGKTERIQPLKLLMLLVGVTGFEPATPTSRT
jgi:hypothetical protein